VVGGKKGGAAAIGRIRRVLDEFIFLNR